MKTTSALDAAKQVVEDLERKLLRWPERYRKPTDVALLRIARAVIEFKCPTCGGSGEIDSFVYMGPCPTCTPLMSALEGLTK